MNLEVDGIDREILRILLKRSPLSGNKIAGFVGLSPPAVNSRLNYLEKYGILKKEKVCKKRVIERKFNGKLKKFKASRCIYWAIDLLEEK